MKWTRTRNGNKNFLFVLLSYIYNINGKIIIFTRAQRSFFLWRWTLSYRVYAKCCVYFVRTANVLLFHFLLFAGLWFIGDLFLFSWSGKYRVIYCNLLSGIFYDNHSISISLSPLVWNVLELDPSFSVLNPIWSPHPQAW